MCVGRRGRRTIGSLVVANPYQTRHRLRLRYEFYALPVTSGPTADPRNGTVKTTWRIRRKPVGRTQKFCRDARSGRAHLPTHRPRFLARCVVSTTKPGSESIARIRPVHLATTAGGSARLPFCASRRSHDSGMDSEHRGLPTACRVGVMMRLSLPLRDALQHRVAATSAASMNSYLEDLVLRDLATGSFDFHVFRAPTSPARGAMGRGRPTAGPRSLILLRVDPALRELIHLRADALGLRLNVYLESLVSQDISAAGTRRGGQNVQPDRVALAWPQLHTTTKASPLQREGFESERFGCNRICHQKTKGLLWTAALTVPHTLRTVQDHHDTTRRTSLRKREQTGVRFLLPRAPLSPPPFSAGSPGSRAPHTSRRRSALGLPTVPPTWR